MIFDAMDVVVVPFPFSDQTKSKKRPALIITPFAEFGTHTDIAQVLMITAAMNSSWPYDVPVTDLECSGLGKACLIRMKVATMTFARIDKRIGSLCSADQLAVRSAFKRLYGL